MRGESPLWWVRWLTQRVHNGDGTWADSPVSATLVFADAFGQFTESGRANNKTWVDFSLSARRGGMQVKVLGYGPST